jgi:hypothetical protein
MTRGTTEPNSAKEVSECCGIRCTEQNLCEIDSGKIMVLVPRQGIRRITLRYGFQAPHPILQIGAGCILLAFGYFPILHLVNWMRHGGELLADAVAFLLPVVVVGIVLIISAFKCGYFLEVEQPNGNSRLAFRGRPNSQKLEEFLAAVERRYNLRISRFI